MKKILALALVMVMIFSFVACEKDTKSNDPIGTWKVDYIEYEGAKFSVQEWENIEYEDYSDFCIVFKEGGKAYVYDDGYGDLIDWLKSENNIMIGQRKCSIVDERISFEYYGDIIWLKKISDSQEIPTEPEDDDEESSVYDYDESSDFEIVSSEDVTSSENNEEWREFLKEYEEWVDDYIELMKKYKENPTDLSLLTEYTEMVGELADWTSRADELESELTDTNAALEYSAELLRIAGKLAEVAY